MAPMKVKSQNSYTHLCWNF